jgi:hypothetical protein
VATPTERPEASVQAPPVMDMTCVGRNQHTFHVAEPARSFGAAWNEPDAAARMAILESIWARKAVNIQPDVEAVVGRQAFSDHIDDFQAGRPGDYFEWRHWSSGYLHHDRIVMYWRICTADDEVLLEGATFGRIGGDGRLVEATAFYAEE